MIKSIRMRHLQKPIITQQIIYNHQEELLDTNSEMSFLKLSQNTSNQLNHPDLDPFLAMEKHLSHLTQRSHLKLKCINSSIKCLETGRDYCLPKRSISELPYRQIIEENKQNTRMAYPKLTLFGEDAENMEECNFEVDQNRNYIKNMILHSRNRDNFSENQKFSRREFYSLQNSRKLSPTQVFYEEAGFTAEKRILSDTLNGKNQENRRKATSLTKSNKTKAAKSNRKEQKKSNVSDCDFKKGRIYEYILSHYSIPKLLAMQPKLNEK